MISPRTSYDRLFGRVIGLLPLLSVSVCAVCLSALSLRLSVPELESRRRVISAGTDSLS